jgi:hypothetical protein
MQVSVLKPVMSAVLVASFMIVSGCASETYLYGEPANALSDVAILSGPSEVVLLMVDDQTLSQPGIGGLTPIDGWETHLLPGRHEIVVFLNSAYHRSRTTLTCDFERGKRYEIHHRIEYGSRGRGIWVAEIYGC